MFTPDEIKAIEALIDKKITAGVIAPKGLIGGLTAKLKKTGAAGSTTRTSTSPQGLRPCSINPAPRAALPIHPQKTHD